MGEELSPLLENCHCCSLHNYFVVIFIHPTPAGGVEQASVREEVLEFPSPDVLPEDQF